MKKNEILFKNKFKEIVLKELSRHKIQNILEYDKSCGFLACSKSLNKDKKLISNLYSKFMDLPKKYRVGIISLKTWNRLPTNPRTCYVRINSINKRDDKLVFSELKSTFYENKHLISFLISKLTPYLLLDYHFIKKEAKYSNGIFALYLFQRVASKYERSRLAKSYIKSGDARVRKNVCHYLSYSNLKKCMKKEKSWSVEHEMRIALGRLKNNSFDYENFFKTEKYILNALSGGNCYQDNRIYRKEFNEKLNRKNALLTLNSLNCYLTDINKEQEEELLVNLESILYDCLCSITKQDALFYINLFEKACSEQLQIKLT